MPFLLMKHIIKKVKVYIGKLIFGYDKCRNVFSKLTYPE